VTVNGRKLDVSSHIVKVGDVIAPKTHKKSESLARERVEGQQGRSVPEWLNLDAQELKGTVTRFPAREDVAIPIQEAYIVEFCSR
jgi:small subunit ribosomal protein S4